MNYRFRFALAVAWFVTVLFMMLLTTGMVGALLVNLLYSAMVDQYTPAYSPDVVLRALGWVMLDWAVLWFLSRTSDWAFREIADYRARIKFREFVRTVGYEKARAAVIGAVWADNLASAPKWLEDNVEDTQIMASLTHRDD